MILEPTQASRHHVVRRILPPTNTYFGTKLSSSDLFVPHQWLTDFRVYLRDGLYLYILLIFLVNKP